MEESRLLRKERGTLAKDFLQSEFLLRFLMPEIESQRMGAYPKPDSPDWEIAYRFAFAKDEVFTNFMQTIQAWVSEAEQIKKQDEDTVKSIF